MPVIRAVRRRSGRMKSKGEIKIRSSEYDCCSKWRLFVMIVSRRSIPLLRIDADE